MHVIAVLTVRFARAFFCASSYLCYFYSSESDLSTSSTFSTSGTQQTPWKTTPLQWWRPLISSNVKFFLLFRNSGSNFRRSKPQPRLESNLKLRGKGYLNLFSVPQIVLPISVLFVTMFDGSDLLHVNDENFSCSVGLLYIHDVQHEFGLPFSAATRSSIVRPFRRCCVEKGPRQPQ